MMVANLGLQTISFRKGSDSLLFAGLFILNLVVKATPIFRGIMIHPDAPVYLWAARALEAGDIQGASSAFSMLFYPFLIMLVHKLGIDWLLAGRLVSLCGSCMALLPFVGIAKRFVTGWPLLLVTLLFIFLPDYNYRAYAVLRDPLYLSFSLFSLYFAVRFIEEKSLKLFFLVIISSIFPPLLRLEGVVTTLFVDFWCFVVLFLSFDKKKKFLAFLILFCSLAILYVALSATDLASLIRLHSFMVFYDKLSLGQLSVQSCLQALDEMYYTLPAASLGSNFWQVIQRHWPWIYFIGVLYIFVKILGWPILILSSIGVFQIAKKRDSRKIFLISLFVVQTTCMLFFYLYKGFLEVRYMLFPAILLLFFLPLSLEQVADLVYDKLLKSFSFKRKYFLVVFSCFLVLPYTYDSFRGRGSIHVPVLKEACLWLKNEVLKEEGEEWIVSGNARRIAWFLDRQDMRQVSNGINYRDIEENFSKSRTSSTLFVFLLNKKVPQYIEMVDTLSKKYPQTSKVFPGDEKTKHFVVAVWKVADN